MTEKTLIVATAILCAFGWSCCNSTQDQAEKLNAEAAKEYLTPIRPASEGSNPCWNEFCKKFTYAPTFDIKPSEGAVAYRFKVNAEEGSGEWSFTSSDPTTDLSPIWASIPPSKV